MKSDRDFARFMLCLTVAKRENMGMRFDVPTIPGQPPLTNEEREEAHRVLADMEERIGLPDIEELEGESRAMFNKRERDYERDQGDE
jgi:hypothetical protein